MASSSREKMASRRSSKGKSGSPATRVLRERMRAKKRPSRRRPAWIDLGGDNPKVVVTHSGKVKRKWINTGHKPG